MHTLHSDSVGVGFVSRKCSVEVHALATILILLLIGACGGDKKKQDAPEVSAAEPPAKVAETPKVEAKPAGPIAKGEGYILEAKAEGPLEPGKDASMHVVLKSQGKFHVNEEYPMKVEPKAPTGVTFKKKVWEKGDAKEFGETVARFEMPFKAEKGTHQVEVHVWFAVCTPENCMPEERTLSVELPVGGAA